MYMEIWKIVFVCVASLIVGICIGVVITSVQK
jgi:uncharacterized protein YneF (UPF0154 family)